MRNFTFRYLPVLVLIAIGIFGANIGARTPRKTIPDSDRLKAEYLFMEANSRLQNNELGTAYYMMRRAAELDSTDPEIAGRWPKSPYLPGCQTQQASKRPTMTCDAVFWPIQRIFRTDCAL